MKTIVIRCLANMLGFYIAAALFPAIQAASLESFFWAGIALGVLNLFIKPLLVFISLPITFLTLGLFTLVINTVLVMMTEHLISGLTIPSFALAFATAFIISVANIIMNGLFD